jgi:hypothetical protein
MSIDPAAREIPVGRLYKVKYSICTLVTDHKEYGEMVDSFIKAGFTAGDCEYLYIDNSRGNKAEAFAGYNLFLDAAQGQYVILCHQDVLPKYDDRNTLELRLAELDKLDPAWGLAGNGGGIAPEIWALRMTDATGDHNSGVFPAKAQSLDENFILIKKEANLCLSHDLEGFHFHGTDLCQLARIVGWNAWVIDFNLYHRSGGNFDESFYEMSRAIAKKYQRALKCGLVQTMGTRLYLSGSAIGNWLWTPSRRRLSFEYNYESRKRQKRGLPARNTPEFLAKPLGPGWMAFYWLFHRIRTPFANLIKSAGKRRRKFFHRDAKAASHGSSGGPP